MYLFGKNSMPDVDNLLTSFYQLDDEARQEVVETIRLKLQYHRDPKRAEQIKQIKGWSKNHSCEWQTFAGVSFFGHRFGTTGLFFNLNLSVFYLADKYFAISLLIIFQIILSLRYRKTRRTEVLRVSYV